MEWTDEGIVLGVRRHGEAHTLAELMTARHGRHLGLVRGGISSKLRPILQPGNGVRAVWRARLDQHLGAFTIEGTHFRADRLMLSATASYGIQTIAALVRLLPERDPHRDIYDALVEIADQLHEPDTAAALIVRFELMLLAELGFGLDLSECAGNGTSEELVYVSPKSGRAISREAGEPWKDQLLALPAFLLQDCGHSAADITAGFTLTGFFLARHVFEPRGIEMPEARAALIATVARGAIAA
ncbi:MAG TPA: DNA repair protein RecO [Xanthobacteraceae bacterium]|nr:DNA repair protein RecO [Xanthobacteraceae bacterium]